MTTDPSQYPTAMGTDRPPLIAMADHRRISGMDMDHHSVTAMADQDQTTKLPRNTAIAGRRLVMALVERRPLTAMADHGRTSATDMDHPAMTAMAGQHQTTDRPPVTAIAGHGLAMALVDQGPLTATTDHSPVIDAQLGR
jgi:hypothetical protein